MKAIFISFNQAFYDDIIDTMDRLSIKGFTAWDTVQGRGSNTGEPHFGNHTWPTLNSAIMTMVEDNVVDKFLEKLSEMDNSAENQGLRAFCWDICKTI